MFIVSTFVSLVALASQAAAFQSRTPENLAGLLDNRAVDLVPRQDPSGFPSQCVSGCTSIINTLSSCNSTSCTCTNSNAADVQSCVNCLVSTAPTAALEAEGQTIVNKFNSECSSAGVQSLTFTATASGSSASSTTAAGGAVGLTSSLSMIGLVGAVVLGGVATIL